MATSQIPWPHETLDYLTPIEYTEKEFIRIRGPLMCDNNKYRPTTIKIPES